MSPSLAAAADALKVPIFSVLLDKVASGVAAIAYGVNQEQACRKFVEILAQAIRGTDPGTIPFSNGQSLSYCLRIHRRKARESSLVIPDALLKRADRIFD